MQNNKIKYGPIGDSSIALLIWTATVIYSLLRSLFISIKMKTDFN